MLNVLFLTSDLSSYCANAVTALCQFAVAMLVATIVAMVLALAFATLGRMSV